MQALSSARPSSFFTLGYQRHTVASMLRVLRKYEVELVVDVRQNPISRKPGFAKARLQLELLRSGIEYLHYPCLGTPPSIRSLYCKNGQVELALRKYAVYLDDKPKCLQSLIDAASAKRFCLLCLENDHKFCHRGVIAARLAEMTRCSPIH